MQLFVPRKGGYYFYSLSINSLTLLNIDRKSRVVAIYDKESMNLFFGKDENLNCTIFFITNQYT